MMRFIWGIDISDRFQAGYKNSKVVPVTKLKTIATNIVIEVATSLIHKKDNA